MSRLKRIMTLFKGRIQIYGTMLVLTATLGRLNYMGHYETWYNLPMRKVVEKAQRNGIVGDYWETEDGLKMYGTCIICAGARERYGELVETSRGMGIILDTGFFTHKNPDDIDLAVTW